VTTALSIVAIIAGLIALWAYLVGVLIVLSTGAGMQRLVPVTDRQVVKQAVFWPVFVARDEWRKQR
jgi:hypothetical protein